MNKRNIFVLAHVVSMIAMLATLEMASADSNMAAADNGDSE